MFIKTRQGRLARKGKAIEETLDAIVSLFVLVKYVWKLHTFYLFKTLIFFDNLNFKVPLKIQVHLGKNIWVIVWERKFSPSFVVMEGLWHPQHWRKNQEIDALKREYAIERNDMIKKFEGLEVVMKFVLKQNTNLNENDIEEMMVQALGNGNSAATHVLDDDDDEVYNETI